MNKFISIFSLFVAAALQAQTYKGVTLNSDGTVAAPADFWTANSESVSDLAPVQSVAGKTGDVTLSKSDVGLGNVDNTSDANKPVSTATLEQIRKPLQFPPAPGLQRLVANLRAGGSDTLGIVGDSTSNGADKWLYPALQDIGTYCGSNLRIVELLNSNGTGQTWTETVLQAGNGAPYFENPVGGASPRSVATAWSPTFAGDVDARYLISLDPQIHGSTATGSASGWLANYGDGAGVGAPYQVNIEPGFANPRVIVYARDAAGTQYQFIHNNALTEANVGAGNALFWLRATLDLDNGSNSVSTLYVSKTSGPSEGLTWTQIGSPVTGAIIPDWTTSVSSFELLGRQTASPITGVRMYRFQMRLGGIGDAVAVGNPQVPHQWHYNYTAPAQINPEARPTLWVINRSVSGGSLSGTISQPEYFPFIFPNFGQSLFVENFGYNDTSGSVLDWQTNLVSLKTEILSRFPRAGLVTIAQPPKLPRPPGENQEAYEGRKRSFRAAQFGANEAQGYVGALQTFQAAVDAGTSLSDLVGNTGINDYTHPTAAGYLLWKEAFLRACGIIPEE